MKKYDLITTYPCLVKFDKEEIFLDENESLEFENENNIFVFPINSKKIKPFKINLEKNDKYYKILQKNNDKNLIYLFLPNNYLFFNIEELTINKENCKVKISNDKLKFETSSNEVEINIEEFESYKTYKIQNLASIKLKYENKEILYCYDIKNNKLYMFSGNSILIENNNITIEENLNNIFSKKKITQYSVNGSKITKENQTFEKKEKAFKIYNEKLIPFTFLDLVKDKDFSSAKELLCFDLQESLSEKHLENYFGKIKNFVPISENEYLVSNNETTDIFTFNIKDNKIIDIEISE